MSVHVARRHLLIALGTVVEVSFLHQEDQLTQLDDRLTEALVCLSRLGVTDRPRFLQALNAAQRCLEQLTTGATQKPLLVRMQLKHADGFLRSACRLVDQLPASPPAAPAPAKRQIPFQGVLTDQERTVIKLCAQGFSVTEIQTRMKRTAALVRMDIKLACEKLKAKNITQAVAIYVAAESEDYAEGEADQ